MEVSPLAGKPAQPSMLLNVPKLIAAYYTETPDPSVPAQRVVFGTSGHRGSAFERSFNERHILAMTQAIFLYRKKDRIDGPLFMGKDTHAISEPAFRSALEVLAENGVDVMIAEKDEYTPTPTVSHAILTHNLGRKTGLADGIVMTPSHNPQTMVASSTILQRVDLPNLLSPAGSKQEPMSSSKTSSQVSKGFPSKGPVERRRSTGATTSMHM